MTLGVRLRIEVEYGYEARDEKTIANKHNKGEAICDG